MTIIIGLALVLLGLAVGFIVTWAFGVGASITLFVGVLLVVAGAIVGFVVEWLIDEAYRRNRELRWQMSQRGAPAVAVGADVGEAAGPDSASETLAEFLERSEEEARELREQLSAAHARLDGLEDEFEAYQRTHPDDLTVVKGIGPVYQWKLRDAGVNTYGQLAAADPDQLRRMLDIKEWQRADVESWVDQARDWAQRET
jgi:predicted flap endonuclease-1-like 5' DNA nuclease